ncbi:MAG: SUMF1/EgtB/PvdO family nonheme iron enzyme [Anaerolineae bacterium]|jgi:formylglycine-generating enzyme required for sulfatase activity|nr:SUMF1/EgtB/PvdO family nonheme iron enzyme [Anaerolineae bacterium]
MMQKNTLQILNQNNLPIGAAFLVSDDLLLTCAHVVNAAGSAAGQAVSLRTPSGTEISATVEAWRDESAEDVASLRLATPLDGMSPLPLGASSGAKGHAFSTYGFPKPDQALSGSGTITGYAILNGIQYLQLESPQVTPGFSGAPVFDEVTQRVVGMVVAIAPPDEYQRQGTTAFAVPAETLRAIVPELQLSERSPYRSLDAFTEADADLFFGRERVVTKLLESLKRNPRFLAVLGPSGSGKSSVVQAGLIPALRNGHLSGSEKWGILSIRPGTQPFEQLASAGMSDPTDLVQAASDWLAAHPENERLLILIDQFEELLVSTPSDIRADFVAALANLLDSPMDVTVLLTLRDDFYNRFTQDAGDLVDWMEAALVNIPPTLEEDELRQIIERPARDLGLVFASGLVDAILADARTADPSGRALRSTVLPLLEFALTQLWERRVDGELTHAAYRAMGGVTGGLSQWADRAYYALDEAQRAIARRVFSELVTLGDETQGIADTRRVRSIAELTAKDGEGTKSVLDALVAARLLVARHDESSGQDTVEIIHETLLREWGLLEGWLQDDRQFLLWREGLRAAQAAWQESGQDAGALLRGMRLRQAEDWVEERPHSLSPQDEKFLRASQAELVKDRRRTRLRWTILVSVILFAVVTTTLALTGELNALIYRPVDMDGYWVSIPAGEFMMGSEIGDSDESPAHWVSLDAFEIGKYEITNRQYAQCVQADICDKPSSSQYSNSVHTRHPITSVSWYDAYIFCEYAGGRLPTEAEWEYAARGGLKEKSYPWGDQAPDCMRANFAPDDYCVGSTSPVGDYPANRYGLYDMAGNVWEWTEDWYANDYDRKVLRGGFWNSEEYSLRVSYRFATTPESRHFSYGFRCAR